MDENTAEFGASQSTPKAQGPYRGATRRLAIGSLAMAGLLAALISLAIGYLNWSANASSQQCCISNARQILSLMLAFAADNGGNFPDGFPDPITGVLPQDANAAFHRLFADDFTKEERIFGSPMSPFSPDSLIGAAPGYPKALEPGENHWALVADLRSVDLGSTPLIFENPATTTWPPKWRDTAGQPSRGRGWWNRTIVVGFVDGSALSLPLEADRDNSAMLIPSSRTRDSRSFDLQTSSVTPRILDIKLPDPTRKPN